MAVKIDGRPYTVHRVVWLWKTGEWPFPEVDHEDRNGTNNRWTNLHEATSTQNQGEQRHGGD
ncbi:HNH endonuclease [Methylocella sp.]|uniref:HNH endonuclease n=1 Tax=Methylocella sp. TaxID=1978226 RepID=UPI003C7517AD